MNLFFWRKPEQPGESSRFGLITAPYKETDYHYGGISGITGEVINASGQWDAYLPKLELQHGTYFDTAACATFSALNCLEILMKKKFNLTLDFSDRFTAKVSGTTKRGNYLYKVADSIRKDGLVPEMEWPFWRGRQARIDWDLYYRKPPRELRKQAKKFLDDYAIQYEWVFTDPDYLMASLQEGPLQVTITCSNQEDENGITTRTLGREEHAVTLYGFVIGKYWKIFDHYLKVEKKLAWDYRFFHALKYEISKRGKPVIPTMKLKENHLYQLVEGKGGFGLAIANKLYVDDTDKLIASFIVRNKGDIKGKTMAIGLQDWDSVPKCNLKGEPISE